ncbi:hypothetical protein ACFS5L_26540 [Streptomyces phyllanthi]|uniref:hypothetical protein n=1 Tax=Streptomyces phyllanthi TaxID=1803180 RepID=UPI0031EA2AF5
MIGSARTAPATPGPGVRTALNRTTAAAGASAGPESAPASTVTAPDGSAATAWRRREDGCRGGSRDA